MSGECLDCGNVICVCKELEKQPDISNCILVDKDYLKQLKADLKIAVEGLEKIKNSVTGGISTDKVNLIGLTNWVANVSIDSLEKIKNQEWEGRLTYFLTLSSKKATSYYLRKSQL